MTLTSRSFADGGVGGGQWGGGGGGEERSEGEREREGGRDGGRGRGVERKGRAREGEICRIQLNEYQEGSGRERL